jgi:hypothetical protein
LTQEEKTALQKIEEFLDNNNIELEYADGADNYIDIMEDRIVVSRHQTPKHIIYTILHEIGHYFSDFHPKQDNKTTTVIEEVLAWDNGRDVAYSLGVDIDDDSWNEIMISSIEKYINC